MWHTCQTSACLRLPCVALWLPQTRFHEDHEEVEWSDPEGGNGDERVIVVMIVVAVVSVLEVVLCGGGSVSVLGYLSG